jgi:oxaloacetate decarboxylase gamma subunit
MTIFEMLGQSGVLAVMGMGTVFSFLVLIVIAVTVMSKVVHALGLDKDVQAQKKAAPATASGVAPDTVAAITAAVTTYRNERA